MAGVTAAQLGEPWRLGACLHGRGLSFCFGGGEVFRKPGMTLDDLLCGRSAHHVIAEPGDDRFQWANHYREVMRLNVWR